MNFAADPTQINFANQPKVETIGAVGGGQLAWMMAIAARSLGISLIVQTPHESDPAVAEAASCVWAAVDDAMATATLADQCQAIAFENEFVDLDALQPIADRGVEFVPPIASLRLLLDKYEQRCYTRDIGLPTPGFCLMETPEDLDLAAVGGGFPVVVKARRHGYDGQGTAIAHSRTEVAAIWERWGRPSVEVEEFIPFTRELAVIAARDRRGNVEIYPIIETQQEDRVCRRAIAPAQVSASVETQCQTIARTLLTALDAIGVFAIELFLTADDRVLVNEIAPRTHNSGHLTIEASHCSQFEQIIRIAAGLPLGDPSLNCAGALMVNLLGTTANQQTEDRQRQQLAAIPGATVHWYGKASRPGRKLGHVTVTFDGVEPGDLRDRALAVSRQIEAIWYGS
ncbi:MAG: 5-(carboxyamino)imidazole ribonucleotide synthase [Coleofasciculaceae cyanobacterium RL_1_1]|nr:5-(carboxyamino)imidazole ribonucleotide synthase [Coleofasciculaceae cyanobacterium RL_1_1]